MSPSPGFKLPGVQQDSGPGAQFNENPYYDRLASPPAPPYSPITPELTSSDLTPNNGAFQYGPPPETAAQPPPPMPFSESDNSDALALRSAISILQIQRQQTLRDMKLLEQQKKLAVADPEGFANAVAAAQIKTKGAGALFVGPNPDAHAEGPPIEEHRDGEGTDEEEVRNATPTKSKFADFPGAQNIVRCPPINWAKYHIVGEPLDKLHEEQRKRPTPGVPHTDDESAKAPEHVIAAPYSPWTDKLPESSMRTRSLAKKEG